MNVIKRDCSIVEFNKDKIIKAITKAMKNGSGILKPKIAEDIADEIEKELNNRDEIEVYEIEDMVFNKLISKKQRLTAKAYEGYRSIREFQRECNNTTDNQILELLNNENEYLKEENSNKNSVLVTTQRDYMAGTMSTDITRRILLSPEIVQAHDEGIIHFHDADYFGQNALHNCFHQKTRFVTSEGIKSFSDFNDGDIVEVLASDGVFRKATVHNYGSDIMYKLIFTSGRSTKEVICTKNHRWILSDGTVTTEIKVGDSLMNLNSICEIPKCNNLHDYQMFALGFVLGDGCDHTKANSHQARLCGHKIEYVDYFVNAGYSISNVKDSNDLIARKRGLIKQDFLNSKSWKYLSLKDKQLLFCGLYAADGAVSSNSLSTSDDRIVELVKDISCLSGYHVSSETLKIRNTEYKNNSKLTTFRFRKEQHDNNHWILKSAKKYLNNNHLLTTWCVEEPITKSFTLENGMVTGNCCLINLEDMLQHGTNINNKHIDKPHRFITACTIATQIITAVASSQYGGTSVTLSHLAPFVRDSYMILLNKYRDRGHKEEDCIKYAKEDLAKEIEDGVQTFNYQINSMSTTNGQAPFITVFMYLNENEEYKNELSMIIEEFIKQRIKGIKNKKGIFVTPAFPKLIYVLEEDNITEDSKYWYLTKMAIECSSKRLVPDYISEKKMKELKEGNCFSSMG